MHRQLRLACLLTSKGIFFFKNLFISTDEKNYRSECMLDKSGISMAPPPRSCLAITSALPAPPSPPSQHTRQRHPEPPAGTNTTGKQTDQPNKKTASNDNLDNTSESGNSDTSTETSSTTSNNDEHPDNKHDECSTTDNEGYCFLLLYYIYFN